MGDLLQILAVHSLEVSVAVKKTWVARELRQSGRPVRLPAIGNVKSFTRKFHKTSSSTIGSKHRRHCKLDKLIASWLTLTSIEESLN